LLVVLLGGWCRAGASSAAGRPWLVRL